MVIYSIKNQPEESFRESYNLFLYVLKQLRYKKRDNLYAIENERDIIKKFPRIIKDRLRDDLYEVVNSKPIEDKNQKDEIISNLLSIIRSW